MGYHVKPASMTVGAGYVQRPPQPGISSFETLGTNQEVRGKEGAQGGGSAPGKSEKGLVFAIPSPSGILSYVSLVLVVVIVSALGC